MTVPLRRFLWKLSRYAQDVRRDLGQWWLRRHVDRWVRAHPDMTFVQIGAHTGEGKDPIYRHLPFMPACRGVLVEPIPRVYERLAEDRGTDSRFTLVRAAVTDRSGVIEMTTVEPWAGMPGWVDQLSSVRRDVVVKHEGEAPGLGDHLRTISVRAVRLEEVLEPLDRLDALIIDTEGHDAVVLDQLDFGRWQPHLVIFEHAHLTRNDLVRCSSRLASAGYKLRSSQTDTVATRA